MRKGNAPCQSRKRTGLRWLLPPDSFCRAPCVQTSAEVETEIERNLLEIFPEVRPHPHILYPYLYDTQ